MAPQYPVQLVGRSGAADNTVATFWVLNGTGLYGAEAIPLVLFGPSRCYRRSSPSTLSTGTPG